MWLNATLWSEVEIRQQLFVVKISKLVKMSYWKGTISTIIIVGVEIILQPKVQKLYNIVFVGWSLVVSQVSSYDDEGVCSNHTSCSWLFFLFFFISPLAFLFKFHHKYPRYSSPMFKMKTKIGHLCVKLLICILNQMMM